MRTTLLFIFLGLSINLLKSQTTAQDYFNQAEIKTSFFDNDGAIIDYKKAIELDSKFAEAYYKIGLLIYNKGEIKEAITYIEKAIENNPSHSDAYYIRAMIKYKNNENEQAVADFNKTIELNGKNTRAYYLRGLAKLNNKDYVGAENDFNITIKQRSKDNPKMQFADAFYYRGIAKKNLGKTDDACSDFKKAKKLGSTASKSIEENECK